MPPLRNPPPYFSFHEYTYTLVVRDGFVCPAYTSPVDVEGKGGGRAGKTFRSGDVIHVLEEAHVTDRFVAVRTADGWVNAWTRDNLQGTAVGIYFVDIVRENK